MRFVQSVARRSTILLAVFAVGVGAVSALASELNGFRNRPAASNPCVEEARLAAVNDSMAHLVAGNAPDPKIYEAKDPLSTKRRGRTYTYEFYLQVFDDYNGGVWPAHEHYEVVVVHDPSARRKSDTCKVKKIKLIEVYY